MGRPAIAAGYVKDCSLKTKQEKKCLGHFNKSQALGVLVQVRSTPCGAPTPCLSTLSSTRRLTISRYGKPHLKAGFTLRCFQRLSLPGAATRLHGWRHDRYTVGPSTPVLSYWGQTPSSFQRPRWIWTELSHDVLNPAHEPTSRCQTSPSIWTLGRDQPVIPRVAFIR